MNSVQQVAKRIVAEMEGVKAECDPVLASNFRRIAIIDYANALRHAPERSPEENENWIRQAREYAAKAVSCGANEASIEESFARLRAFWVPRLKEVPNAGT